MTCLADNAIRNDFLNGENGAIKIESTDMELLDKLYIIINIILNIRYIYISI